jgi:hypothetical protein
MSVRVFLCRKVLTPAFRADRAFEDPAGVRGLELQANFASLLSLRLILVLGVRLAHLLLCRRAHRNPAGRRDADGKRCASSNARREIALASRMMLLSFMPTAVERHDAPP